MTGSRILHDVLRQTNELSVKNDAGFRAIQSQMKSFCSSQHVSRSIYQSKSANHESHLGKLQEQLYFEKPVPDGVYNTRERVVTANMQSPCPRRKSYVDLLIFGQISSSCRATARQGSRWPSINHLTYTFIPPAWLSYLVLHWDLHIHKTFNRPPKISLSISPIRYNPSRELKAAVTRFDTLGLRRLFQEGHAHPKDYIVQRRPVTLLEVGLEVPL